GLPDQVRINYDEHNNQGIFVRLNTGYSFLAEEEWSTPVSLERVSSRVNVNTSIKPPISPSFALGLGASTSTAKTEVHLVDVNGDGLPDLVYKSGTRYYYYPNTGTGFHTTSLLLYNGDISENKSLSGNIFGLGTVGFVVPLVFINLKSTFTASASVSASLNETTIAFQDIDGDGLPDVLSQVGDGTSIRVRQNQIGKTGLLKKVNTPLGGS